MPKEIKEMEKEVKEMPEKKESSAEVKTIEKCGVCINFRRDNYNSEGKCLRHKDGANFITVNADNNYCEQFDAMPKEEKETDEVCPKC